MDHLVALILAVLMISGLALTLLILWLYLRGIERKIDRLELALHEIRQEINYLRRH